MSSIDEPYIVEGRLQVGGSSKGVDLSEGQTELEVGYKLRALNVIPYGS